MSKSGEEKVQEALRRIADLEAEVYRKAEKLANLEPNATRRAEITHQRGQIRQAVHKTVVKVKKWNERRGGVKGRVDNAR